MLLSNTIKPQPCSTERHRKKFVWYVAQDIDGQVYTARTMHTLAKAVNKTCKPATYCYSQHLYHVASGHQASPHKGVTVHRLDSEENYDCWKKKWESEEGKIYLELF